MNVRPLEDRVVIRPREQEDKTPGGIVLPDNAKEKPVRGVVVAVGPGKYMSETTQRQPVSIEVGDEVLYGKYSGSEITVDNEELKIMRESDVLAVVSNKD